MVVIYHFAIASHLYTVDFVRNAFLFVDFFFVLSGFVIAINYMDRLMAGFGLGRFMVLRFGRVWPLHAFILMLYVALELVLLSSPLLEQAVGRTAFSDEKHSLYAIATNLALVHSLPGVHEEVTWNGPSWSISVEFYSYLIFAVGLLVVARLPKPRMWLMAGVAALMLLAPLVIFQLGERQNIFLTTGGGLIRCLYGFAAGVAAALIWQRYGKPLSALMARRGVGTGVELAALLGVIVFVSLIGFSSFNLVAPYVFLIVILAFAPQAGAVSRVLLTKPFLWLGSLSYSIYMVHYIVQAVMHWVWDWVRIRSGHELFDRLPGYETADALVPTERLLTGDLYVVGVTALVIGLSALTYEYVEKPGRDAFRRLSQRLPAGARAKGAAPAGTNL
jgi:peptidoglycan/LPS O-acetylase OafA/YrhL